jgi:uncharacterized protein
MSKLFVNSHELYKYSRALGENIIEGYKPDFVLGISRGGCMTGIIIHEYLNYKGIECSYSNISCKSYNNSNTQTNEHVIDCSKHTLKRLQNSKHILIVDDVFDTGFTMMHILNYLSRYNIYSNKIKIGTIYFKSNNNKSTIIPDFYIQTCDKWIVFPHELMGLTKEEVTMKDDHEHNSL